MSTIKNFRKKPLAIIALALAGVLLLAGCSSDADNASYNLGRSAEQFEVQRRITVINTFSSVVALEVEGRCSIESAASFLEGALEVTCKIAPNAYVKHFVVKGDNDAVAVQQLDTIDVSVYHHRVIVKPENILPEFDYEGGEQ
jgi:hypothetical protein